MAHGVAAVWVPVENMDRALAFYRDTLGLEVQHEGHDWSEVNAGGLRIGLNAREDTHAVDGGAVISFQPDTSIDDEYAQLEAAGVRMTGRISDHSWGRIAPFKDSEGNDLQLYAPPA